MQFLFISTLFPNSVNPTRALYNLRHLSAIRDLGHTVQVIAPVPWFPGARLLGRPVPPTRECHAGFDVRHPRFLAPPGLLVHQHYRFYRLAVTSLAMRIANADIPGAGHQQEPQANRGAGRQVEDRNRWHVILGFAYPDAVAMAPVCANQGWDYSVFVLGSDFRQRRQQPGIGNNVMATLRSAPLIFCPGQALRNDMIAAGLDANRIHAFNNGVDGRLFHP